MPTTTPRTVPPVTIFAATAMVVAIAGCDPRPHEVVKLRDLGKSQFRLSLGSGSTLERFTFAPDGTIVAGTNWDTIRAWAFPSGKLLYQLPATLQSGCIRFTADGRELRVIERTRKQFAIHTFDAKTGARLKFQPVTDVPEHFDAFQFSLSADAKWFYTNREALLVWDAATGRRMPRRESIRLARAGTTISQDGIVTTWSPHFIAQYDLTSGGAEVFREKLSRLDGRQIRHTLSVRAGNPSGTLLACYDHDLKHIVFWDTNKRTFVGGQIPAHEKAWKSGPASLSADGTRFLFWFDRGERGHVVDRQLAVYDVATGALVSEIDHPDQVLMMYAHDAPLLSPRGDYALFHANKVVFQAVDVTTGQPVSSLDDPTGSIAQLQFSDDGHALLVSSQDKLQIWSVKDGEAGAILPGKAEDRWCWGHGSPHEQGWLVGNAQALIMHRYRDGPDVDKADYWSGLTLFDGRTGAPIRSWELGHFADLQSMAVEPTGTLAYAVVDMHGQSPERYLIRIPLNKDCRPHRVSLPHAVDKYDRRSAAPLLSASAGFAMQREAILGWPNNWWRLEQVGEMTAFRRILEDGSISDTVFRRLPTATSQSCDGWAFGGAGNQQYRRKTRKRRIKRMFSHLQVFDVQTGLARVSRTRELERGEQAFGRMAISPDSRIVAVCRGNVMEFWSLFDESWLGKIEHAQRVTAMTWGPRGLLATGHDDGQVTLWDASEAWAAVIPARKLSQRRLDQCWSDLLADGPVPWLACKALLGDPESATRLIVRELRQVTPMFQLPNLMRRTLKRDEIALEARDQFKHIVHRHVDRLTELILSTKVQEAFVDRRPDDASFGTTTPPGTRRQLLLIYVAGKVGNQACREALARAATGATWAAETHAARQELARLNP